MRVKFENVVDGINRYIDKEILRKLDGMQEFVARLVIGRINQNVDSVKELLMNNGFIKTLSIIDSEGMVDIDHLLQDVRKEIDRQGCIHVNVPLIGKLTFKAEDVDALRSEIMGGIA